MLSGCSHCCFTAGLLTLPGEIFYADSDFHSTALKRLSGKPKAARIGGMCGKIQQ
jgi:hypothetical protein